MKNNLYRLTMVILCVAGILFTVSTVNAQALTIVVAAESQVTGSYFTLGDIASISGDDSNRIAELSQIKLGSTPLPGRSYIFTVELLNTRLSAANADLTNIAWQVPQQFKVTALSQQIDGQRLVADAEKFLKNKLNGSDVLITSLSQPQDIFVPPGMVDFNLELPYGIRYNSPTNVSIGVQVSGRTFTIAKLRFDVKKYEQVAVTSRPIAANETITPDAIIFERRDIGRMPPGYFTGLNKILGLTVKRQLGPGLVLNDSMVAKPIVIKRGQAVNITAKVGDIEVSTSGVALQNGSIGQFIRVQNINSKKVVNGRIIDESTVQTQI